MSGNVYIVHAVDTEGPLYEGLDGLFSEIKEHFDISLESTQENVELLRNRQIDLGGKEALAAYFVRPDRVERYNETWVQIDKMHATFMSPDWRQKLADSHGNPYVVSWFCMDHVGFNYNPRRRAMGYHEIYQYYVAKISEYQANRDGIYWHYHPASFSGNAHRMGYNYSYSENLHNEIVTRRIIDHMWFPVANRPGGHIETYDINTWLEAWIPFDIANQSMDKNNTLEEEEASGRIPGRHGDWRGATTDWEIYNPSLYDFRQKGNLKRWIARCLNMNSRHSNISKKEIQRAFKKARNGEDVLLSYTNHDFRDMIEETETLFRDIKEVAQEFPDVEFLWANAVEAFRKVLKLPKTTVPQFKIDINDKRLRLNLEQGSIWGVQPFLALKTHDNRYFHDNFILDGNDQWTYPFDKNSMELLSLNKIGFACNDTVGNTVSTVIDVNTLNHKTKIRHTDDWI
jgi:hypothetical protein